MDLLSLLGTVCEQHTLSGENVFFSKCQILLQSTDKNRKRLLPWRQINTMRIVKLSHSDTKFHHHIFIGTATFLSGTWKIQCYSQEWFHNWKGTLPLQLEVEIPVWWEFPQIKSWKSCTKGNKWKCFAELAFLSSSLQRRWVTALLSS